MIATLFVNVLIFTVVAGIAAGPFFSLWAFVQGCKVIKSVVKSSCHPDGPIVASG